MKDKQKYHIDDDIITGAVQSVRTEIPAHVEEKTASILRTWRQGEERVKTLPTPGKLFWVPAAAFASVVLAVLFIARPFGGSPQEKAPIEEIRTEMEIEDKNIKIIWFQKKDFKLSKIIKPNKRRQES